MTTDKIMQIATEKYLDRNIEFLKLLKTQAHLIVQIAEKFIETLQNGNKILFFGNGGSAADAQHLTAELVGRFKCERKALPAISLTANTSSLTSIGNDYDFEDIFSRQVEALGKDGDLAVGITTSGNSKNVLKAVDAAKQIGMGTVGFTGGDGGALSKAVDLAFIAPAQETANIQEMHITTGHIICQLVESKLFKP
jgi:D-sedoheptulose 7-phosphate isomerase